MTELSNSRRDYLQAIYTPVKLNEQSSSNGPATESKRAWEKWNFVASLKPTVAETEELKSKITDTPAHKDSLNAIKAIKSIIPDLGTRDAPRGIPLFSNIKADTLAGIANKLIEIRQKEVDLAVRDARSISENFSKHHSYEQVIGRPQDYEIPPDWKEIKKPLGRSIKSASVYHLEKKIHVQGASLKTKAETQKTDSSSQGISSSGERHVIGAVKVPLATPREVGTALPGGDSSPKSTINTMLVWADKNNVHSAAIPQIMNIAKNLPLNTKGMTLGDFINLSQIYINHLQDLKSAFVQRMANSPVGYLHLERLGFTPAGIEKGELLYSVPLSPDEVVNIAHQEWSNTSEEFQKIETDSQEGYSEQGVSEKAELAQSTLSQQQHSSGLNTAVSASGSYGPVSVSTSFGYNMSDSASKSEQLSRNNSATMTRKASSRTKQEHKISFKVASASGTADQTVRMIKNPFPNLATRVDYYQLIRKWKVDLYRYGVRLTYDLTIPEPGSEILGKIQQINDISQALLQEFSFSLLPQDISVDPTSPNYYLTLAATYGASGLETPPENTLYIQHHEEQTIHAGDKDKFKTFSFDIDVDPNYDVSSIILTKTIWSFWDSHTSSNSTFNVDFEGVDATGNDSILNLLGKSGKLSVVYVSQWLNVFTINVDVTTTVKDDVFIAWQLKTWSTIHDAAQSTYEENLQNLQKRLDQLNSELLDDPLSLRKAEREEIMKNVLRWLNIPNFEFEPSTVPSDLYDTKSELVTTQAQVWSTVTSQGDITTFLHNAIEWENMLYFLYPYFWSNLSRWELKKYLEHPDIMHKEFLKSGSARVVLTIRPGFEEDFICFMENGNLVDCPTSPYVTIAQEMQNYANTNYPGVPSANPVQDARPLILPKQRQAWNDMQNIFKLLTAYQKTNGTYPTTAQGLPALAPFTSGNPNGVPGISNVPLQDPWGNNYVYKFPGDHDLDYDLVSYGADGKEGGDDENADITNWAEASLIGTWFEYTPTSAMDISFNEILPDA